MAGNYSKGLELLEDRHIMGVILMLYATGPSRKNVIYKEVSSVGTMPRKLDRLTEAGILAATVKDGFTEYSLTESGRMVASDLCRLREHILRASGLPRRACPCASADYVPCTARRPGPDRCSALPPSLLPDRDNSMPRPG